MTFPSENDSSQSQSGQSPAFKFSESKLKNKQSTDEKSKKAKLKNELYLNGVSNELKKGAFDSSEAVPATFEDAQIGINTMPEFIPQDSKWSKAPQGQTLSMLEGQDSSKIGKTASILDPNRRSSSENALSSTLFEDLGDDKNSFFKLFSQGISKGTTSYSEEKLDKNKVFLESNAGKKKNDKNKLDGSTNKDSLILGSSISKAIKNSLKQTKSVFSRALYTPEGSFGQRNWEKNNSQTVSQQGWDIKRTERFVSITYEEIGLFPRSFNRVFDRFLKQIFSDVENLVLQEYRFYRFLFLTTIKTLFILFFVPLFINLFAKNYIVRPLTEYFWNTKQPEIFLNSYQQKRAFFELQEFEEQLFFESLISPVSVSRRDIANSAQTMSVLEAQTTSAPLLGVFNLGLGPQAQVEPLEELQSSIERQASWQTFSQQTSSSNSLNPQLSGLPGEFLSLYANEAVPSGIPIGESISSTVLGSQDSFVLTNDFYKNKLGLVEKTLQQKTLELAIRYNNYSIEAITNFFADLVSFITLLYLLISLEIQINITKSFLLEVFFGLDDSKKSLLILLVTDLLVGYHSPNIWELFFEFIFNHYGIPESQTVIFLLVATLPVLLDVLFKYLIFRHLNRSSPTTVATYHAMIE